MNSYDLVVIGSGPAGEKGAAQAAYFGKSVALIEREAFVGGACVNTGTIPSKTLRESALHLTGFKQRELFGLDVAIRDISISNFMYRERHVVEDQWRLIERNLARHSIVRYRGAARFLDAHRIAVRHGEDEDIVRGEVVLIATGSSPHHPPEVPFDHDSIYDSDSILRIDRIPRSMAVVGAGVIGCEYASIFAALGVQVHLVDGRTALLPHIDSEIVEILLRSFSKNLSITLHLGADVDRIATQRDGCVILDLHDGSSVTVDKVLYAAGRSSNTGDLDLPAAGVMTGKRGLILVNERYQTNVSNIYAAGDVIGFPALASTSMEQARVAMVHAFDLKYKTAMAKILPYGIYTIPEISTVGETEQSCMEKGIAYEVGRAFHQKNPRGQIIGDSDGLIKLVFDPKTLRLLGVHIVGENSSELLHVGLMVMHFDGTINAFIENVFNFPTLGDGYKYAAYDGLGNVARRPHHT